MRDSWKKLRALCLNSTDDPRWFSNLEATRWLDHISLLLSCSVRIGRLVEKGYSVLIHCSDGWDR